MESKTNGQLIYEVYAETVGGVDFSGQPLRGFAALTGKMKAGWEAAAQFAFDMGLVEAEERNANK